MSNRFSTAKGLSTFAYASSIASTWVWAPAIFVASAVACQYGIEGLLWFLIPNALTLVLFGYVSQKVNFSGVTASDVVVESPKQEILHKAISILLLGCSTFVQLLGVYYLASAWFDLPRFVSGLCVLLFALLLIWKGGLRACIFTDIIKYLLMVVIGWVLFFTWRTTEFVIPNVDSVNLALTFGMPTAIGLLCAPYVDSTFWQRAFSIERTKRFKTFLLSAGLFLLVPLSFGLIGLGQPEGWNIQTAFTLNAAKVLLAIAVLSALISTIDSNICAFGAYFKTQKSIILFSALTLLAFVTFTNLTIVDMFLFYGTVRTVASMPSILMIFKRADYQRLFYATLVATIVCPTGFALCKFFGAPDWSVLFTVLAVLIPLFGYKGVCNK